MPTKYVKQICLGHDPATGKRIRKWIHANTQLELANRIQDAKREMLEAPNASGVTFKTYSEKWLEVYKANRSARTKDMYTYGLRKCSDLDGFPLKSVTKMQCQQILNDLWETPRTAKIVRDTMKQVFKAAIADGIVSRNPAADLDIPESQRKEKNLLTAKELKAIKNADMDPQDRMFVTILQVFGLRPAEALALSPADFDLKSRILTISKAVELRNDNTSRIKDTKTGITRKIPIPAVLVPRLRSYFRENPGFLLFSKGNSELMTKSGYRRMSERVWRAVNKKLGGDEQHNLVKGRNFYDFRHYRATELYYLCQSGKISTKYAAEILGHSETIFLKTYSHIDMKKEQNDALYQGLKSIVNL